MRLFSISEILVNQHKKNDIEGKLHSFTERTLFTLPQSQIGKIPKNMMCTVSRGTNNANQYC